jgi:hypothetical protein
VTRRTSEVRRLLVRERARTFAEHERANDEQNYVSTYESRKTHLDASRLEQSPHRAAFDVFSRTVARACIRVYEVQTHASPISTAERIDDGSAASPAREP